MAIDPVCQYRFTYEESEANSIQGTLTNEPNAVEIEVTFRNFGSTPQAKKYALKRLDTVI